MRTRTAAFAVTAAALGILAGCGDNKCNDQTPPISAVPSCTAGAETQVSVPINVCPRCDQGPTTCTVDLASANPMGGNAIELVPLSPVCEANSSCPIVDPASCPAAAVNCTFTTPATLGSYTLVVITPEGTQVPNKTFNVAASGSLNCTGFSL